MQIQLFSWSHVRPKALPIRLKVFVEEQLVPFEMEEDEFDQVATHALLTFNNHDIGTARLFQENLHSSYFLIGRLCVLKEYRGKGYGRAMMIRLIEEARNQGGTICSIHAQSEAKDFYESLGFKSSSDPFMEAGIKHVMMQRVF
jgi:predicted GNAT family N-acyltransferase